MEAIDRWTARHACALQLALRMTQDDLAATLGVARRTVAAWHERPEVILRAEFQRALDTVYERAPQAAKVRFARQFKADDSSGIEVVKAAGQVALTVAIAIVITEVDVLVVCRRDPDPAGITWQFPAGVVKPGASGPTVAVRETLAETGVHCVVREQLGSRVHPLSNVNCEYYRCEYLAGTVENLDTAENVSAIWVPRHDVTRFIPADRIYLPVLHALERAI